jgi:hypothetical protein
MSSGRTVNVRANSSDDLAPSATYYIRGTHILEGNIDFAANLTLRVIRNADAARLGNALKPRRNVDAIAKNITVIDDDVADMDADAKFYQLILR